MNPIDIRGLDKSFGSTKALDRLDLTVAPGEVRGFLGRYPEFAVVPPAQVALALGDRADEFLAATLQSPEGLLMTPRRTGTDGFFVSVLCKAG